MSDRKRSPIAVVGIAGIYPKAASVEALWRNLVEGESAVRPVPEERWDSPDQTAVQLGAFLETVEINLARLGIPPVQAVSIAKAQLLTFEVVDRCLRDSGFADRPFDRDRTDVICGCCFGFDRTYANAARITSSKLTAHFVRALAELGVPMDTEEAERITRDLKQRYRARYGGSAHDRVGEMASTIPARIAARFRFRGRCLAVESADATSFAALKIAVDNLRQGLCDVAVVATAQLWDSPLNFVALGKKGLLAGGAALPLSRRGSGYALGEGVGAMLLQRLDTAVRDGSQIHCVLGGLGWKHTSQAGSFRYSASAEDRSASLLAACEEADYPIDSLQHVECFGSGLPQESQLELQGLAGALGTGTSSRPVSVSCSKALTGHTFACDGTTSLIKLALAFRKRTLPPFSGDELEGRLRSSPVAQPWPENTPGLPRRAAIGGASLTGSVYHLVLEEFVPERARAPVAVPRRDTRIAVVGMGAGCAAGLGWEAIWKSICAKRDTLHPLEEADFDRSIYFDAGSADASKSYTDVGSKMRIPDLPFETFRIFPKRLAYLDAAQILALHAAQQAFGDAGAGRAANGRQAVIVATNLSLSAERSANTRLLYPEMERVMHACPAFGNLSFVQRARIVGRLREEMAESEPPVTNWSLDGYLASGIAALISNHFSLNAVPVAVEAACASSLAAVDIAMRGLANGEFDFVVAGGVELPVNTRDMVLCSSLGLLSKDKITPFDVRADGFSVGDGAGIFLLKRLEDARDAGDRIFAVLRGSGASCDARSLIAPDESGQILAMRRAFEGVDFGPDAIDYLEAHGTGTQLGDLVETRSIKAVYGVGQRQRPMAIGSIKSMIGHAFAAAGAMGLLRAILAIYHKALPPNINLEKVNPALELEEICAYVSRELQGWPQPASGVRRAAVSSFGTGGLNYHILLEEFR